jgi:phosphoadenosine phosphosulfate reductase
MQQMMIGGSTRQQFLYDSAINLLRMAEPPEGYYLATSFGKDSIVVHRLLDEAGVKYDAHNNHTGIDPPELVYFGRKYYPDVARDYPSKSIWRSIVEHGVPPTRIMRYCCGELKEQHGKGRTKVFGIRAAESMRRAKRWGIVSEYDGERRRMFDNDDIQQSLHSCGATGAHTWIVNPLFYWTDTDVWDFIHDRHIPYCELYDQGYKRLGCIGCPMATPHERRFEFERYPQYKQAYIRAFDRMVATGKTRVWKDGTACFYWWMRAVKAGARPIKGQIAVAFGDEEDSDNE